MNLPKEFSDHPSLVGILRIPECSYSVTDITIPLVFKDSENKFMSVKYVVQTAIDILPVSSDTTTTIASDSCEIPAADLCLVPSPLDILLSFDNGSIQAAALILFSLIITAPS